MSQRPQRRGSEESLMPVGESFAGGEAEAAHVNTVLGRRSGPVAVAWATSLATPRAGPNDMPATAIRDS
ncbi:MAG: formaldehyde-activating enzyme [Streptosporangiaceae bacterium]|jgi:formaldehyde-activating enzyme involved in methanogenesis